MLMLFILKTDQVNCRKKRKEDGKENWEKGINMLCVCKLEITTKTCMPHN